MKKRTVEFGRRTAFAALALAVLTTAGCHRDPNKQKQKYLESGKRYSADGKYKEAAIQFSNALKVDRNFAEAHYQLGDTYLKMGSVMPGYSELSRAVALQPNNQKARIDLGNLLLAGKQFDRAAEQANAVLASNPQSADAHALLSSVAAGIGLKPLLRFSRLSQSIRTARNSTRRSVFCKVETPPSQRPPKNNFGRRSPWMARMR